MQLLVRIAVGLKKFTRDNLGPREAERRRSLQEWKQEYANDFGNAKAASS